MGRRSAGGFLIELAVIGALAAGAWVQKNSSVSGGYVIIPALAILVPLYFWNYMRPWGRRRKKWRPRIVGQQRQSYDKRTRWNGWQQPKEQQYPTWAVYAAAAVLMVGTFCAVFFWPSSEPSEAASIEASPSPAPSPLNAPSPYRPSKQTFANVPERSEAPAEASDAYQVPSDRFLCNVSRITDGDTLRCADGTRVRLHAVAARESDETCKPGHPCPSASAASATAMLSSLASAQTLQCEQTGTSYGRVTAVCWNQQNTEINCAMVNSGTTLVWPKFNQQRAICR